MKNGTRQIWEKRDLRTQQLIGLEGRRVEVKTLEGDKRRFWVGRNSASAPWQIHLEVKRRDSSGGVQADQYYASVRVIR